MIRRDHEGWHHLRGHPSKAAAVYDDETLV